jgi:hypothetical protein
MDGQLVLQLRDPFPCGHQLRMIGAGHAWHLAAVYQLLPPPGIDHLRADLQIIGNLSDRAASGDQVQDFPAELGRVSPRHNILHGF